MAPPKRAPARRRPPVKKVSAPATVKEPQRKKAEPVEEPRIKAVDFDKIMRRALGVSPKPKVKPAKSGKG